MTGAKTRDTKPGRLTDNKWWFCEIGEHGKCVVEIELTSRFEGCPCECHQTATTTQPAPETGEWRIFEHYRNAAGERTRILNADGVLVAETQNGAHAAQIVRDHKAVSKLVEALRRRVSPTKCYCEVMLGAKCGECADRELLASLGAALAAAGQGEDG